VCIAVWSFCIYGCTSGNISLTSGIMMVTPQRILYLAFVVFLCEGKVLFQFTNCVWST